MTDPEYIPVGDDLFINPAGMVSGSYSVTESSQVAESCLGTCGPEEIVSSSATNALAQVCMQNALQGGGQLESVIEVDIQCTGPKRKLLGGRKCGAKVAVEQVIKPLDDN